MTKKRYRMLTSDSRRQSEEMLARDVGKVKSTPQKAMKTILPARFIAVGLLFLLCCLLLPLTSRADSPTEQVRATVDKVLIIVRVAKPNSTVQMNQTASSTG